MEPVTVWGWTTGIISVLLILWGLGLVIYERVKEFLYDFEVVESNSGQFIYANHMLGIRISDLSAQIQELKNESFASIHDIAELKAYIHDHELDQVAKLSKAKYEALKKNKTMAKAKAKPVKKK